jgi:hypothetical protein
MAGWTLTLHDATVFSKASALHGLWGPGGKEEDSGRKKSI